MTKIYACLIGDWVDITTVGTVADHQDPVTYFKEQLTYDEGSNVATCFKYDYINVQYQGANYRVHPSMIQIVSQR